MFLGTDSGRFVERPIQIQLTHNLTNFNQFLQMFDMFNSWCSPRCNCFMISGWNPILRKNFFSGWVFLPPPPKWKAGNFGRWQCVKRTLGCTQVDLSMLHSAAVSCHLCQSITNPVVTLHENTSQLCRLPYLIKIASRDVVEQRGADEPSFRAERGKESKSKDR